MSRLECVIGWWGCTMLQLIASRWSCSMLGLTMIINKNWSATTWFLRSTTILGKWRKWKSIMTGTLLAPLSQIRASQRNLLLLQSKASNLDMMFSKARDVVYQCVMRKNWQTSLNQNIRSAYLTPNLHLFRRSNEN
jgi:hypothetical protein